jgi:hypothetical protein
LLASQLAQALGDRDAQAILAQENAQKLNKSARETELLQKQLDDLGRQIQGLLKEVARRDNPTIPPDDDLEQLPPIEPAEKNIETVITYNLVMFCSIRGLQVQNQKLLRIVGELGAKLEAEEKDCREATDKEQGDAVKEAYEAIQELEGQKMGSEVTIQAYMKEMDALKSMLSRAMVVNDHEFDVEKMALKKSAHDIVETSRGTRHQDKGAVLDQTTCPVSSTSQMHLLRDSQTVWLFFDPQTKSVLTVYGFASPSFIRVLMHRAQTNTADVCRAQTAAASIRRAQTTTTSIRRA